MTASPLPHILAHPVGRAKLKLNSQQPSFTKRVREPFGFILTFGEHGLVAVKPRENWMRVEEAKIYQVFKAPGE